MLKPLDWLTAIVAKLRAPDGCPWDREQTHTSLKAALVEETYETLEAIESGDDEHLREELGDLLLQVIMHSQIASERNAFTLNDVANGINYKLTSRHPHVFEPYPTTQPPSEPARPSPQTADQVVSLWHRVKSAEKSERTSAMDGVPLPLPSLARAQKIQQQAARAGFDWENMEGVLDKITEEIGELKTELAAPERSRERVEAELGDLFFSVVNLARHLKIDAETCVRLATRRFEGRYRRMEEIVGKNGPDAWAKLSLDEKERAWQQAKDEESAAKT
jgi:tetrapyrrole methylase family protein/MazG family protein